MRLIPSLLLSMFFLLGCEHHDEHPKAKLPKITTMIPQYGDFSTPISASATVAPSPDGIVTISPLLNGIVHAIHVQIGDHVSRSTPLLSIRSSDVSDARSEYRSAQAAYAQAKHLYAMNQDLYTLGAISANDLAQSKSNYLQAQALMQSYADKLNYLGASSNQLVQIHSPIAGVVYEISTHLGEKVSMDGEGILLKIANPHKKVIIATVYEKDLSAFEVGKEVSIDLEERPPLHGRVHYISDVLDPQNKTAQVYITPEQDDPQLHLNRFVTITLNAPKINVFRLPKSALLYKEGKFIVFIAQGKGFRPIPVTLISDDPKDNFSLVQGLPQHTPVAREAIALEQL